MDDERVDMDESIPTNESSSNYISREKTSRARCDTVMMKMISAFVSTLLLIMLTFVAWLKMEWILMFGFLFFALCAGIISVKFLVEWEDEEEKRYSF